MRIVALLFALASAIGFSVVPGQTATAVTPVQAAVTFAPVSSGILRPGEDLLLTGTIANSTGEALPAGTATVYLDRAVASSRDDLASWLEEAEAVPAERLGAVVATAATPPVPAGRMVSVSITVPAAAVALPDAASAWGARPLAVQVTGPASMIGQSRSAIVWYPGASAPTTRVALAVPLAVPGSTTGLISAEELQMYTGPNGLLTRQLNQALSTGVALGIDPMILASIRILGDSAPETAVAWLTRLEAAPNDSFALGYADYDLAAVSQAGVPAPLAPTGFPVDPALFPGATPVPTTTPTTTPTTAPEPTPSPTPSPTQTASPGPILPTVESLTQFPYTLTGLGWPQDDTVVEKDLDWMSAGGMPTSILSSDNVNYKLDYTPSSGARIGAHGALISDADISAQFRRAAGSTDDVGWANAMAGLSASIATVSRERPGETRTVLATLGRDDIGGNSWFSQTVSGLGVLPWSSTAAFSDLVATAADSPVSATVEPRPESSERIASVAAMLSAEQRIGAFSTVLEDPSVLTGPQRLSLMAALSGSWDRQSSASTTAIQSYLATANEVTSAVSIADSGGLLLTSTSSRISVSITNKLDWPVSVYLTVRPLNGNLYIEKSQVLATIEADSQAKIEIPVEALANGQTTIETSLTSPTSIPLSQPAFLEVDVHADWETVFTAVIAIVVVLVFGFGIWRTVAKRRKAKRMPPAEESDDQPAAETPETEGDRPAAENPEGEEAPAREDEPTTPGQQRQDDE